MTTKILKLKLDMNDISSFIIGKHFKDNAGELKSVKLQNDGTYRVECKIESSQLAEAN